MCATTFSLDALVKDREKRGAYPKEATKATLEKWVKVEGRARELILQKRLENNNTLASESGGSV